MEVFYGDNHIFHVDVMKRSAHETPNVNEVQHCPTWREDVQLVVALTKHDVTNQQTTKVVINIGSSYDCPNALVS